MLLVQGSNDDHSAPPTDSSMSSNSLRSRSSDSSSSGISIPESSGGKEESSEEISQSCRDLAPQPYALPPRRPTHVSTVCEEFDDFEYDEGNRFILDRDL